MRWRTGAVALALAATLAAGCGKDEGLRPASTTASEQRSAEEEAQRAERRAEREREREAAARAAADQAAQHPEPPSCPADADNCAAAAGRILALESLDPDGDGDLHVVIAGGDVTIPGLTVLDVAAELRPAVDPRVGDWAAGAGPVYEGTYGQRQIEVDELVVDPPRGPSPP